MKLEVRRPEATDLLGGGAQWQPPDRESVWFLLGFEVGEKGDERADLFYVTVATPEAIRSRRQRGGRPAGAKLLVIEREYSWARVIEKLREKVEACADEDWTRSVDKLCACFDWEYEGYNG